MALGDEFKVNTTTQFWQGDASTAKLKNGGYIVVWEGKDADGDGVFGQLLNSDGSPNGGEFLVNTNTAKGQSLPHVTVLNDGHFVVTWYSVSAEDPSAGVFAQIFSAGGARQGGEFLVNTFIPGAQIVRGIASLENGGFVITWDSGNSFTYQTQDGDDGGAYAQVYDTGGTRVGEEIQVNTHIPDDQSHTKVVGLKDGRFVVVWESYRQDGEGDGIFAQIFTAAGVKSGDEFQVNSYIIWDQGLPDIARLTDGGFVVIWQSIDQDGDLGGIYANIFNPDGSSQTGEFKINATTDGHQSRPSVAGLEDGGFIATWTSVDEIVGQKFNSAGLVNGDEFQINTYAEDKQDKSDVIDAGNGNIFVAWDSWEQDGNKMGVYAKIVGQSEIEPPLDVSVVTYKSLQVGDAKAWHNGDGTVTYSYLDTEMPSYYSSVDIPESNGGNDNSSPDGWAINADETGSPLAVVSFSANFEVTFGQIVAIDQAIELWNEIANVNLVLGTVSGQSYGDITFGAYDGRTVDGTRDTAPTIGTAGQPSNYPAGFASFPDPSALGSNVENGNVWLNNSANDISAAPSGGFGFSTILHEIGHAIGLSHPNDAPSNNSTEFNSEKYTLMSYLTHPNSNLDGDTVNFDKLSFASTPMLIDIQAIQNLYGANQNTRIGDNTYFGTGTDSTYQIADGKTKIVAIWDALGIDTFDASNQTKYVLIDLNPGAYSTIGSIQNNIVIASGLDKDGKAIPNADSAWIENATGGSADDIIIGNILDNVLLGGGGGDAIEGGGGLDTIDGGEGIDSLFLQGTKAEYSISEGKNGVTTVQDNVLSRDGTAQITNIEFIVFSNETMAVNTQIDWTTDAPSIEVSAASYQFFTGGAPSEAGFKFLISSSDNQADLNDDYYTQFNTENRFINFANNLGAFGAGKEAFSQKYGALTFNQTIKSAFEEIIGSQAITDSGGNPQNSLDFFNGSQAFYAAVAAERIVPSGIELDLATKVVAVGSILNEAMKGNIGLYSDAIDVLVNDISTTGTSNLYGHDLFG